MGSEVRQRISRYQSSICYFSTRGRDPQSFHSLCSSLPVPPATHVLLAALTKAGSTIISCLVLGTAHLSLYQATHSAVTATSLQSSPFTTRHHHLRWRAAFSPLASPRITLCFVLNDCVTPPLPSLYHTEFSCLVLATAVHMASRKHAANSPEFPVLAAHNLYAGEIRGDGELSFFPKLQLL